MKGTRYLCDIEDPAWRLEDSQNGEWFQKNKNKRKFDFLKAHPELTDGHRWTTIITRGKQARTATTSWRIAIGEAARSGTQVCQRDTEPGCLLEEGGLG